MLITMFTDVSVIHDVGAYGVWAKSAGRIIRHADIFRNPVSGFNFAEICGVINGLSIVLKRANPPSGTRIMAQTVSELAIQVLQGANRHPSFSKLIEGRDAVLKDTGVSVSYVLVRRRAIAGTPWDAWCSKEPKRILLEKQPVMA